MPDLELLEALRADVDEWNRMRAEQPDLRPDLAGLSLHGLNLCLADMRHVILRGADLSMADLTGADFRWSDLRGANLVGARMIGTDLEGADLRGTDLRTAEDLTEEQLAETIGDEKTRIPDHTPRPARWTIELAGR